MSLTSARGPLGTEPGRLVLDAAARRGVVFVEPHLRRVQGVVGGQAVIDTERALLVHRAGRPLSFAFPADEVGDLPAEPEPEAPGYVQVPWDAVDAWYEEGRKLVHYPPNPYHRVDCRPDDAPPPGRGRRHDAGRHRRHDHPLRDGPRTPSSTSLPLGSAPTCCGAPTRRPTATTRAWPRTGPR